MRMLTLFSGIGVAEAASTWVEHVAAAEIEPFPSSVLKERFPHVRNLGDVSKFKEWTGLGSIDIVCGGAPCQAFSVAGLREGLNDPRGNLTLTFLGVVERYRPTWVVFENVPGILSSTSHSAPDQCPPDINLDGDDGPEDGKEVVVTDDYESDESHAFACFLAGLSELGYGFAYRTFDAQYVRTRRHPRAVPQRRRRVFVVGYLGDWRRAAAVLFDGESLRGHPPPRREAGEGITLRIAPSLRTRSNSAHRLDMEAVVASTGDVAHCLRGDGFDASEDGTGRGTPLVPIAFSAKDHGGDAASGVSPTLRAGTHSGSHANAGVMPAIAFTTSGYGAEVGPVASTMQASFDRLSNQVYGCIPSPWAVRRLTPLECERLQGVPDGWTDVPHRGKPAADGPRYKALGNAWALNCGEYVFEGIKRVEAMP